MLTLQHEAQSAGAEMHCLDEAGGGAQWGHCGGGVLPVVVVCCWCTSGPGTVVFGAGGVPAVVVWWCSALVCEAEVSPASRALPM